MLYICFQFITHMNESLVRFLRSQFYFTLLKCSISMSNNTTNDHWSGPIKMFLKNLIQYLYINSVIPGSAWFYLLWFLISVKRADDGTIFLEVLESVKFSWWPPTGWTHNSWKVKIYHISDGVLITVDVV